LQPGVLIKGLRGPSARKYRYVRDPNSLGALDRPLLDTLAEQLQSMSFHSLLRVGRRTRSQRALGTMAIEGERDGETGVQTKEFSHSPLRD